jgi:branched-subunit amino acid transport protein
MSAPTIVVLVLAAGTYFWKGLGPLVLGNRPLPTKLQSIISVMPAPLLAALVVTATVGGDRQWTFDARLVGLAFAIGALVLKRGFVTVVIVAAAATAAARALGMS